MADLDLDALEALLAQATPAPWTHFPDVAADDAANSEARVCYTRDGATCEWCVALAGATDDAGAWTPETLARWHADAALIAAMRNALPALIARVRKAEARADAAEKEAERLRGYTVHRHAQDVRSGRSCAITTHQKGLTPTWGREPPEPACTCGLDTAKGTPNV